MRALTFLPLTLPLTLAADFPLSSTKRGLIYVSTENPSDDHYWTSSDLTWYYNYEASPTTSLEHDSRLHFVPMLWGAGESAGEFYDTVKGLVEGGMNVSYVLGFNEPDGCDNGGSCVPADTAAAIWISQMEPLKRDLGIKLGAPAVTSAPTGFTWLQNFFTRCAGRCSADFIPVHYYGGFEGMASHIGQVNATYMNMSMWVTEYGYPEQSLEVTQGFFNESGAFLERVPYIDRYSYFGSFRSDVSNVGPNATMLTQDGELTDIGAWYLGDASAAVGNIPEGDAAQVAGFAGWAIVVLGVSFWLLG